LDVAADTGLTPLAAALIAAAAVLGGGVVTAAASLFLDSRRASRERDSAQKREARELRLATRLVIEELADAQNLLEGAVREVAYWRPPRQLSTSVWTEYRAVLAAHVDSPWTWRVITIAFDEVNRLNWLVGTRFRSLPPLSGHAQQVEVATDDDTRQAWRAMRAGIGELEKLIGVMGPASRMLGEVEEREDQLWPGGSGLAA
jgi:hypothetical protein